MDATSSNPSTLKIEDGSLGVTKWTVTSAAAATNATVAVSGGTFKAAAPENYCAEGHAPAANADGTYGVKLPEGAYLLQDYRNGEQPLGPIRLRKAWRSPVDTRTLRSRPPALQAMSRALPMPSLSISPICCCTRAARRGWTLLNLLNLRGCALVTRWPFPKAQTLLRTTGTSRRFRHLSRRMFAGWQTTMF